MDKNAFVRQINLIQELLFEKTELIKAILDELHVHFPKDETGFSELEFYIFSQNFGKPACDSEYESPEMLWMRLNKVNL